MSTYPIHTKPLTRSTTRPVTRLAVGAAVHGSVPGQTQYHPYAKDYFSRVEALGGGFANHYYAESETKAALSDFFRRLDDTGVWPAIAELYLMAGCDFAGLPAKAKYIATPNITWVNFVAGDYAPSGVALGLAGNTDSKYGNTSVQPYTQVSDDIGVGAMIEDAPSPYGVIIGNLGIDHLYTVNLTWDDVRGGITARLKSSAGASQPRMTMPLVTGPTTAIRQGDDMRGIQGDQVEVVWQEPVSGDTNANTLHLFRRNNNSTPSYFDGRLSAAWVTDGATPQQIIDLHSAINTLRNALQDPVSAPVFTQHPQSITIDEGEPLILSALATGVPSPTYGPWKKDGIDLPGTTNRILNRGTATLDMAGSYTVPAANVAGTVMSNAAMVNVLSSWHPDATNYLTPVETADGQALEPAVALAWDVFFRAMDDPAFPTPTAATHKIALQAGTAIPMIGARTLAGALVPLYSGMPTPTNIGFVSGDYNRATGLKGDGTSKYIDLSILDSVLPQNDYAYGVCTTTMPGRGQAFIGSGSGSSSGISRLGNATNNENHFFCRNRSGSASSYTVESILGFAASSRDNGSNYSTLAGGESSIANTASQTPQGFPVFAFATSDNGSSPTLLCSATLIASFVSQSIDLAYMDSCLTTLQSSIAAALS